MEIPIIQTSNIETIYLIRHAKSVANEAGIICGQIDAELSAKGLQDLSEYRDNPTLRKILTLPCFVSPLKRALNTAQILGFSQIQTVDGLKETDSGSISDWTFSQVADSFPQVKHHSMDLNFRYPDGETTMEMIIRSQKSIELACAASPNQRELVIVAHNGSINAILSSLLGVSLSSFPSFSIRHNRISIVAKTNPEANFWNLKGMNI